MMLTPAHPGQWECKGNHYEKAGITSTYPSIWWKVHIIDLCASQMSRKNLAGTSFPEVTSRLPSWQQRWVKLLTFSKRSELIEPLLLLDKCEELGTFSLFHFVLIYG